MINHSCIALSKQPLFSIHPAVGIIWYTHSMIFIIPSGYALGNYEYHFVCIYQIIPPAGCNTYYLDYGMHSMLWSFVDNEVFKTAKLPRDRCLNSLETWHTHKLMITKHNKINDKEKVYMMLSVISSFKVKVHCNIRRPSKMDLRWNSRHSGLDICLTCYNIISRWLITAIQNIGSDRLKGLSHTFASMT